MTDERWSTNFYKVLKSSWGIWISITAVIRDGDAAESIGDDGVTTAALELSGRAAELPIGHQRALRTGWAMVSPEAVRAHRRSMCVTVNDVTFVDTDFQVDALAVAMCRWVEKEFGLRPRDIEVTFDAEQNRYGFAWFNSDLGGPGRAESSSPDGR